jgi:nitrogen fixation/metabolism regulation signal transduction histidine kinase
LTIVASRRLSQSIDVWQSPGTKRSLESSLVLARKSLSKYEADLRLLSARLDGDPSLVPPVRAGRWDDVEFLLSRKLQPLAVDFLQLYERQEDTWALRTEVAGSETSPPGSFSPELIRRALESEEAIRSEAGYVAFPFPLRGADGMLVVAGYRLDEDFFTNVGEVTEGILQYGRLEVYKRVAKQSVWVTAALLFGIAAVVSLVAAALLARQLSRPILGLTQGMKRVAVGKLDEKVDVKAGGEIGYLVDSFNRMTDDLRLYKEQLARAERVAAWQDVARYVAHEIRNPLTPIKVSLHRLRSSLEELNEKDREKSSECLDSILGEVTSLEKLATSFSEFAKLPEPALAPVDVNKIIKEVAELHRSAKVRIDLSLNPSLPLVSADAQQIRMAFTNIVKNASEAMPDGGSLEISSSASSPERVGASAGEAEKSLVEIEFKDTGCGIPQELIDQVTTPHFTTKKSGTGLGLAFVSTIISQHGGRIVIRSREAEGTLVKILLPAQLPT